MGCIIGMYVMWSIAIIQEHVNVCLRHVLSGLCFLHRVLLQHAWITYFFPCSSCPLLYSMCRKPFTATVVQSGLRSHPLSCTVRITTGSGPSLTPFLHSRNSSPWNVKGYIALGPTISPFYTCWGEFWGWYLKIPLPVAMGREQITSFHKNWRNGCY